MPRPRAAVEPERAARARLVDVAELGGVSKSAASRILNGDRTLQVSPETRERVWRAAAQLGYRPHAGARALAGARTGALALLVPDLTNVTYAQIVRGAYRQARDRGYVVLLAEDTADQQADESFMALVETGRVDGLLIGSARDAHALLASASLAAVPHVFVNREVEGSNRNVGMDLPAASRAAVDHLYALGHRRIGHIAGPFELQTAHARERGYVERAAELGLDGACIERAEFNEAGGADAAARLLAAHPELTAIYASVLGQAIGAMHAMRKLGLRVPDDVSLIASDDDPVADYLDPPLTTVAMPLAVLGAAAVDALLAQIDGGAPVDVRIPGEPRVVIRGSTRRIG